MTSWWSIHLGLLSISDSSLSAHQRIVLAGEGSFAFSSGQVRPTRGSPALRTSFAVKKNLTAKNAKDSQRTQSKSLGQRQTASLPAFVLHCPSLVPQVMIQSRFLLPISL